MQIRIIPLEKKFARQCHQMTRVARFFIRVLYYAKSDFEVYLLGDRFWKRHREEFKRTKRGRHMARDGFNVLSYPHSLFPGPYRKKMLGIVYLDLDYIERRGEDAVFMLLHGILHLLGYGHVRKNDRIRMERQERRLLEMFAKRRRV